MLGRNHFCKQPTTSSSQLARCLHFVRFWNIPSSCPVDPRLCQLRPSPIPQNPHHIARAPCSVLLQNLARPGHGSHHGMLRRHLASLSLHYPYCHGMITTAISLDLATNFTCLFPLSTSRSQSSCVESFWDWNARPPPPWLGSATGAVEGPSICIVCTSYLYIYIYTYTYVCVYIYIYICICICISAESQT